MAHDPVGDAARAPAPEALARLAAEVAREAADLVRAAARGRVEVADTKTSELDVVTETDRASERLVRERLLAARPGDSVLGEEGGEEGGTPAGSAGLAGSAGSGVRWVVDPIDGTVNFLYGLPQYAVSIAAEVDGTAVAGAVVAVPDGTTYTAWVGDGENPAVALRDGVPLRVREPGPLDLLLVATGFSYDREVRRVQAAAVARLLPQVRDVRRLGSCALDLCHVAEGTLDAYVEEGVQLWDHAAAGLVARAAGARTTLLPGAGGLDLLVCAAAPAHDDFVSLVTSCGFVASDASRP